MLGLSSSLKLSNTVYKFNQIFVLYINHKPKINYLIIHFKLESQGYSVCVPIYPILLLQWNPSTSRFSQWFQMYSWSTQKYEYYGLIYFNI